MRYSYISLVCNCIFVCISDFCIIMWTNLYFLWACWVNMSVGIDVWSQIYPDDDDDDCPQVSWSNIRPRLTLLLPSSLIFLLVFFFVFRIYFRIYCTICSKEIIRICVYLNRYTWNRNTRSRYLLFLLFKTSLDYISPQSAPLWTCSILRWNMAYLKHNFVFQAGHGRNDSATFFSFFRDLSCCCVHNFHQCDWFLLIHNLLRVMCPHNQKSRELKSGLWPGHGGALIILPLNFSSC